MPAWSSPIPLNTNYADKVPKEAGVYEIGFYRDGSFTVMYVGRASKILWYSVNVGSFVDIVML